jgi:ribokinase
MGEVVVVGSINLDLVALVERLPGPGETVAGRSGGALLGGKGANQAVAAHRAGAVTRLLGAVGTDGAAATVLAELRATGLDTAGLARVPGPTGVAHVLVGGGDNMIVVVAGANAALDPVRIAAAPFAPGDVCVGQLETNAEALLAGFRRAREAGALTLFNPAPALPDRMAEPAALSDVIVANETEWSLLTGGGFDAADPAAGLAAAARDPSLAGAQLLVATLGARGVCAWIGGEIFSLPGHAVPVTDTTGAGDCFCGYLAAGLALGEAPRTALAQANAAAALAVQTPGGAASVPHRRMVDAFLA